jgi:hypothetical protein
LAVDWLGTAITTVASAFCEGGWVPHPERSAMMADPAIAATTGRINRPLFKRSLLCMFGLPFADVEVLMNSGYASAAPADKGVGRSSDDHNGRGQRDGRGERRPPPAD